jgi:hypothetical protein
VDKGAEILHASGYLYHPPYAMYTNLSVMEQASLALTAFYPNESQWLDL